MVSGLTGSSLLEGSYYKITNFRTCYDQPDFDYQNNPITTGNYKQALVEPIIVFAISNDEISSTAYQPKYPNDRIQYDWTWSETEVTGGTAYGRISERIDEFNNRTDYDHRTVLFKRYDNYYYKENNIAEGTIELIENTGEVIGTETVFSDYNTGDYIAIPNTDVTFFEIVSISGDTSMVVSGLTIPAVSAGTSFYSAQKAGITYKQNNISSGYTENPTFLFDNETIISNYIGDVAMNGNDFLLPNNVFGEDVIGNRIGNNFMNNTFSSDVEHNIIGDYFENNTIYNDSDFANNKIANNFRNHLIICDGFYANVIGDGINNNKFFNNNNIVDNQIGVRFNDNTIYSDFGDNKIGNDFYSNVIDGSFTHNSIGNQFNNNDTYQNFNDNSIGHDFNNNTIYSSFYKNEILDNFNDNIIGDSDNLTNFQFSGNRIGNSFNENTVREDFQNNQIGTDFGSNEIRRWFRNNTIQNDFSNNTTNGYENSNNNEFIYFEDNSIGNDFSDNEISYTFKDNIIGNNFNNNITGRRFENNNIGNNFNNNRPFNSQLFNWNNLSNLTDRIFRTFGYSLDQAVGQYVVGTEMVMRIVSTGQYFKIIFTQWTQGNNGGGFSYSRQEIDSNGNNIGNVVYFTKTNGGSEVDVIVEGVVEITRGNNNVIYNVAVEEDADSDVSPEDTEWNNIFTEVTEVFNFQNNLIQNDFHDNLFDGGFNDNTVGNDFNQNELHGDFYNNTVGNDAYSNEIYIEFYDNSIGNDFSNNNINIDFYDNKIGNDFNNNETMLIFNGNTIGDGFNDNLIDSQLSGWNNLSNVAGRNYEVWRNSLEGNVGNYILDRELVMKIISTGQYFKIRFTKWTQGHGGGFSYNRQEIDSNGTNIGSEVSFTKENFSNDVDVIVEGVVEIARGNQNGIYNIATESNYSQNNSPVDTRWNSIFSQQNGDIKFRNNVIGNSFDNNDCLGRFAYNTIADIFDTNVIGNNFQWNVVNTYVDNIDFTTNYGNIVGFTYTATGASATDGTYTLPISTTSSYGVSSTFEIQVDNNIVIGVTVSDSGRLYQVGDKLTILGEEIDGNTPDDNVVITVTEVTVPSVYEEYTCQIFERQGGNKRLSFYDSSDILTIKNINE